MSERSTGVIILGILAVAGLGLSGYMFVKDEFLFPSNTVIKHVWHIEKLGSTDSTNPTSEYVDVPSMNLLATVNAGESLYLLFSSNVGIYDSGLNPLKFKIKMNGILFDNPYVDVGRGSDSTVLYCSVNLQYINSTIPAGTYNISICYYSLSTANWIKDSSLLVYTFV